MTPSPMTTLVEEYLAYRHNLGFALRVDGRQLLSFARFADATGHNGGITCDLVVQWAIQPGPHARRFAGRTVDVVRPFARYCAAFDPTVEVPPSGILGPSRHRPVHHIFTTSEIAALVTAARQLAPVDALRPATYATMFGLLAAFGLRVSEALRLTRDDVDLAGGVLTVHLTKFRKSRLVPLHPTTTTALRNYAKQRDQARQRAVASAFFVSERGHALPYGTVRSVFRSLSRTLGWDVRVPRPRIHDLRHAFACERITRWYAEGIDVATRVAALATYLGHAKVSDTYWYLTGTPDLLARAADRFQTFAADPGGAP